MVTGGRLRCQPAGVPPAETRMQPMSLTVLDHPLAYDLLSRLRERGTGPPSSGR